MNMVYLELKKAAERGIKNQIRKPNDFYNASGLLVCGTCKAPRQKIISVSDPTPLEPNRRFELIAPIPCKCEEEAAERLKKEKAAAAQMQKIQRLKKESLIDERLAKASFDIFKPSKTNGRLLKLCKRYVDKFDKMVEKNQGLLFWGDVGTGKSFAAACIANALLDNGVPVIMTSFVKLLSLIQNEGNGEEDALRGINAAKLVIFDDFGAERSTDYALEKVYNIVDNRYRQKLPMIFTTNLNHEAMMAEEDIRYKRIYDRIFETCYPVQVTGKSWRKGEASRRFTEMKQTLEDN